MDQDVEEFFHDFRQGTLAHAEASSTYQLEAFMEAVSSELIETGFVEGFEHCHYRALRGIRVDGYWFNDEGALDVFVADFECRQDLATLTQSEVEAAFKRAINFVEASLRGALEPDITTPEYGLVQEISARKAGLRQVNFFLTSERVLSDRFQGVPDATIGGVPATFHIWDMARFQRQSSSRGRKEPLDIDFIEMFGDGISCLPANLGSDSYQSYLIVMPATILAQLYDTFSARLLEQNVRTFLQARAKVNQGIRTTILREPQMFFAYNNGITATAQKVETRVTAGALQVVRITDLQIVNGGQTTASLFHTQRRDNANLSEIFVQMKLSVIDSEQSETVVPRISEFANTQNRVNAADFFSNHPFHVRMAEFSRRIWAPAPQGAQRETKWFYERARGQYADEQAKLSRGEQRRFKAEYPKPQMFTKTDLAKFENVWDDHPKWVNLGAQKNFARYAVRIGDEWSKSAAGFSQLYYQRLIARAILFRRAEKLVSEQRWYNGGYRANIVAYSLAVIGECSRRRRQAPDWQRIWNGQSVYQSLDDALAIVAQFVNELISSPPRGISNISEWCKKDACWDRLLLALPELEQLLPDEVFDDLESLDAQANKNRHGKQVQRTEDGIKAEMRVMEIPAATWKTILQEGMKRRLFTTKEIESLRIAQQIPAKHPSPKQCMFLLEALDKLSDDGFEFPTP